MLFFPHKLRESYYLFKNSLKISASVHLLIILFTIVWCLLNIKTNKLVIGKKSGASVSFSKRTSSRLRHTFDSAAPRSRLTPSATQLTATPTAGRHKKTDITSKNSEQPNYSKFVRTEKSQIKEYTLFKRKKIEQPIEEVKEKIEPKQEVAQEKIIEPQLKQIETEKAEILNSDTSITIGQDIDADSVSNDDALLIQEIKDNIAIPPGFEDHKAITITYEIGYDGSVINFCERVDSIAPAIYIALKKAIFKCYYPKNKWGTKIELTYVPK